MRNEQLHRIWPRWLSFILLVLSLFAPPLRADTKTDPVGENCPGVSVQAKSGVALGTVRTLPGGRGFLELHPRHGISVSNGGAVHEDPWGSAVLNLDGPPEVRVSLELAMQQTSTHHTESLRLSELIVLVGGETRRLESEGGSLSLRLPEQERADGSARMQLEIGAVFAFRHHRNPQEARYRLTASCLSMQP